MGTGPISGAYHPHLMPPAPDAGKEKEDVVPKTPLREQWRFDERILESSDSLPSILEEGKEEGVNADFPSSIPPPPFEIL
jgi:hypothetical protein